MSRLDEFEPKDKKKRKTLNEAEGDAEEPDVADGDDSDSDDDSDDDDGGDDE